jgi:NADPH:quinone reductase-like Zn-dependent oxidoreductase
VNVLTFLRARPADHDATMNQLVGWLQSGDVSPSLTDVVKMADGRSALRRIASRSVMGKIVLVP